MTAALKRNPLTDAVLTRLRTQGSPIGDGVLPDGNWIGQPNLPGSEFEAFAVLSEMEARDSFGGLGQTQANWRMPYLIESFGVLREQCGWMAGELRGLLTVMRHTTLTLGDDQYRVVYANVDAIGAPTRIDVTDPEFWHQQDVITVTIGRKTT